MISEKYNLIQTLQQKNEELIGDKKLSLQGQGDFYGANNVMRSAMNIKHHKQHLCIDNPEFPMFFDGKENVKGKYSSYYTKTDKEYKIIKTGAVIPEDYITKNLQLVDDKLSVSNSIVVYNLLSQENLNKINSEEESNEK